ncbi:hypothetical protein ACN2MM_14565 [Alkalilimnicola ehrlichii MLHE-1]|uniref:Nucleotidyltransferase n=1 Tax=Alkalilimnicola ehrlichii (strain ATCC BAA-1101 / DSM 17681 / MLHE-1) TaxID=187272 RepID=Q0A4Z4_ALKEH|nr:hypothetical protein [Alkalilimnicola ehrlichii]ABI58093.1 conserved hypothetical protein [Alkalilimnicola ehrlichii MLHE-1]
MAKRSSTKDLRMRERLIQEAARIMADEGVRDHYQAKRKAAERLGARDTRNLPSNREVQAALVEYQRLFLGAEQGAYLRLLREAAVQAMAFFEPFRPRLVGPVLSGTADQACDVHLHVFAETPEEITLFLMERGIPHETSERRLRFGREHWEMRPVIRFVAGEHVVDLTVFSPKGLREAPRSQVDGRPMQRAALAEVEALLANEDEDRAAEPFLP